jgi:hypothetical protein
MINFDLKTSTSGTYAGQEPVFEQEFANEMIQHYRDKMGADPDR